MNIPKSILDKIVKPISKKTGLSPEVVTLIITIGVPLILKALQRKTVKKSITKS